MSKISQNLLPLKKISTYESNNCDMAVNTSCAKCDQPLVDDILKLDDGSKVQNSRSPECEG